MTTALSILTSNLASKFDMGDGSGLLDTLKSTAFKSSIQVTDAQMTALLVVASQYGLNPFTREIYAFPDKGGIVPVVGIDGWSRIMNTHDQFDGMEFKFDSESCTCIIYRKDRSHPTSATEYMEECKRDNSPAWKSHPRRMLRHKAMIQAARLAFGFTGIYDQDEAERIVEVKGKEIDITPEEKTLPEYTSDKFDANKGAWVSAINSGKHTPDSIINMISTKHTLTDEQKDAIKKLGAKDERAA
ncbi:MAG: phage recombination protein Bet [Patescibacteria group bacterium]